MPPSLWSWRSCFTSKDLGSFMRVYTREGTSGPQPPVCVDPSDPRPVWNGATQQEGSGGWVTEPSFFCCSLLLSLLSLNHHRPCPPSMESFHETGPWSMKRLGIAGAASPSVSPGWRQAVWGLGSALSSTAALTQGILGKTLVLSSPEGSTL